MEIEENKEASLDDAIEEAVKMFFSADKSIANTTCSRGGVIRALRFAMHTNLTDKKIKLRDKQEEKLAFYFMIMLDNRTVMQAKMFDDLNKKEQKDNNNKEGEL